MGRDRRCLGQLFCVNYREGTQEELTYTYGILKPGACMFRAMPLERAHAFAEQLRQKAEIPLFIATNLEKGGNGILTEGTLYASPMEIEATANEQRAVQLAQVCAQGAACVGANWSFAPIIDIDRNFRNPITNTRTFGSDSEMVRKLGSAYVRTIQSQGFAATIKHFPGDGCDERDQHLVTSINDLSCEEWDNTYGATYKACIDDGALCCMVAWLSLPQMILYTALYLLSQWLMPHITPQMLADFKACGGLLLFAMGLKMAKMRQIAILDLLPALLLAPILSCIF